MSFSHHVKIIIENFNSDDVISYPLLFIKGIVKCENCDFLFNGLVRLFNDKSFKSEFQVIEGKFKVLHELEIGVNSVRLSVNFDPKHVGEVSLRFKRTNYQSSNKVVKVMYIIPRGDLGEFQAKNEFDNSKVVACKKINLGTKLLQTLIAERLYEEGLGRKSFICDNDCIVFQSKKYSKEDFMAADGETIWNMTAKELLEEGIITENVKVFAFLSSTRYCSENKKVQAAVACGRGQLAMLGSASLHSWPSNLNEVHLCLSSQMPIDSKLLDDSGFRGTMGGCFATSLGSAAHELGHLFDLVHSDYGIMARGFEDIDLFFTVNPSPLLHQYSNHFPNKTCCNGIEVKGRNSAIVASFTSGSSERNCVDYKDGRARFHRSAATLLAGHKWFIAETNEPNEGPIVISGLEIRAPNGLRLIELISPNADLLKFWDFSKNPFRLHRFCLNVLDVRLDEDGLPPSVQVQDCRGEILRKDLSL